MVVDVGVGGRGFHCLQPGLVHWERGGQRALCWHLACGWASSCLPPHPTLTEVHACLAGYSLELLLLQLVAALLQGGAQFWRVRAAAALDALGVGASSCQTPIQPRISGAEVPLKGGIPA